MLGTATKLKTARNIALSGAITGNVNFDGSGNVNIVTTQNNIAVVDFVGRYNVQTNIAYPNGFNPQNCAVLSISKFNSSGLYYDTNIDVKVQIGGSTIIATPGSTYTDETRFKMILMKVS